MRLVVQRVKQAHVDVEGQTVGKINQGLLVLLGIHTDDTEEEIPWFINKLLHLRIFTDDEGKMNRDVQEVGGEILVVSQFTLYGDCSKGRRPSFIQAAPPPLAEPLYDSFVQQVERQLGAVQTGRFGAKMDVHLLNDGPITLIVEK